MVEERIKMDVDDEGRYIIPPSTTERLLADLLHEVRGLRADLTKLASIGRAKHR